MRRREWLIRLGAKIHATREELAKAEAMLADKEREFDVLLEGHAKERASERLPSAAT